MDAVVNPSVAIIILNWNGWLDTIECLESLEEMHYDNYNIILIDNGSSDSSIQQLEAHLRIKSDSIQNNSFSDEYVDIYGRSMGGTIIFIKNRANYGFARGNNIGIKYAIHELNSKYILLLNNDTIVYSEFLSELIGEAEKDSRIGICGAKLLNAFNKSIIDSTGHIIRWGAVIDRGHGEVDIGQYDDKPEVIGAMAACCLYRKEMIDEIGYLDESFNTMYEDAEFSWRAYKFGWKGRFVPTAIVYHKRGKSVRSDYSVLNRMILLSMRNSAVTAGRYGSKNQMALFSILLLRDAILLIISRILGRNKISIRAIISLLISSYNILLIKLIGL